MIASDIERRNPDASLRDLILYNRDGVIVQLLGIQIELHAGEAFGFHELEVGIGIIAENAEFRFPTRHPTARLRLGLRLSQGCCYRRSCQKSTSRNGHGVLFYPQKENGSGPKIRSR